MIDFLEQIEKRANNPLDVKEPLIYVYNCRNRSTITMDISLWNKIKEKSKAGQL